MEERKERALNQRLYLLEADYSTEKNGKWKFIVRGSTGNRYSVSISSNSVFCNCFDCKRRKSACKHIYFIVGRVAQDGELLSRMGSQLNYPILDQITPKLLARLRRTGEVPGEVPPMPPRDTTCSICYEDLTDQPEQCKKCNNGYHDECIKLWLQNKDTCPMCRTNWGRDETDGLSMYLGKLTIN